MSRVAVVSGAMGLTSGQAARARELPFLVGIACFVAALGCEFLPGLHAVAVLVSTLGTLFTVRGLFGDARSC